MEFTAYSSYSQGRKASALWKVQDALHGSNSLILPATLLLAAATFVVYAHVSASNSIRNFLAMIVLSMIPLAFLEKRILACPDPLSAISKFSGKLLLSHGSVFVTRLPKLYDDDETMSLFFHVGAVLAVCVLLPTCFRIRSPRALFYENRDVWSIMLLGSVAAVLTEAVKQFWTPQWRRLGASRLISEMVGTGSLYLELLAFAPAVAMMCRVDGNRSTQMTKETDVEDTRSRTLILFTCLLAFYFYEDVVSAYQYREVAPLAAMGHVAHFVLLLDFAGFVLAHFFDPSKLEKLVGAIRDIFADSCAV